VERSSEGKLKKQSSEKVYTDTRALTEGMRRMDALS
jgi:hypothetical protein